MIANLNNASRSYHFIEKDHGFHHGWLPGAPDAWAESYGATHTLLTQYGPLPLILKKTVAYVGVDEADGGGIVWEKWNLKYDKYLDPSRGL